MESKEALLISNLRKNSRAPLTQISKKTNIPVSTLFDMLRKKEPIRRHTCLPNFSRLGYGVKALFLVKVPFEKKKECRQFLLQHPHLNSLFKINNGYDFFFEMIYKELSELEQFSEDLEKRFILQQKTVHYLVEDMAREHFFSDPEQCAAFKLW